MRIIRYVKENEKQLLCRDKRKQGGGSSVYRFYVVD